MNQTLRWSLLVVSLVGMLGLCGCGQQGIATYPVRGKVVFSDGEPVKFGRVEFYHSEHDLTSHGTIQADGSFQLGTYEKQDGAPAGSHEVVVTQLIMPGETSITPHDHGRHVDNKYASYETSGIQVEVAASRTNECRIVLDK